MTIEAAGQNESAARWKCNEHCAGVPRKKEVENAARRVLGVEGVHGAAAPVSSIFRLCGCGGPAWRSCPGNRIFLQTCSTPCGGAKSFVLKVINIYFRWPA